MAPDNLLTRIFVYGTLKRNQPNYKHMLTYKAKFIDNAVTVDKWPLVIATEFNVPFLINKKGHGKYVKGEVYDVDQQTVEFLDDFEAIHKNLYNRIKIEVAIKDTVHNAYCYVLTDFKEILLKEIEYLDNYDTNCDSQPSHISREVSKPNRLQLMLEQVKA